MTFRGERHHLSENVTRLVIVCGLPGSGKTTHAKLLEHRLDAVRFCPDEWFEALSLDLYDEAPRDRIEGLQWELAQRLLKRGVSVIIDGVRGAKRSEMHYASELENLVHVLNSTTSRRQVDTLFERVRNRDSESPPVTREQILQWVAGLQEPTPEEAALFDGYIRLG